MKVSLRLPGIKLVITTSSHKRAESRPLDRPPPTTEHHQGQFDAADPHHDDRPAHLRFGFSEDRG